MKNIITRGLAIALLITSTAAFGSSGDRKAGKKSNPNNTDSGATTVSCPADQNDPGQDQEESDKNNDKSEQQRKIKQQEKEWLQALQGIHG
jgi:hypothetical protein